MTRLATFSLLLTIALFSLKMSATAAVFVIPNGDVIALKSAIDSSNANGEDDTIELATGGTYTLTTIDNFSNGLPRITPDNGHKLTIHGNGATLERSFDTGTPSFRILYINSLADVSISNLTLDNGGYGMNGGTIYIDGVGGPAKLTLTDSSITNSHGYYGGAIYSAGFSSSGGATLVVTNCTFFHNLSDYNGGAIYSDGAIGGNTSLIVTGSTFNLNFNKANSGGAIQHVGYQGTATGSITNCTFNSNYAASNGAAVYIDGSGGNAGLTITNCTFNENTADGAATLFNGAGNAVQIGNNIFKSDGFTQNIFTGGATIMSLGHNLSDDSGNGVLVGPGDLTNTQPMLAGPIANNGGPTQTIALQSTSPAVNAGGDTLAPTWDQRYYRRSGVSDIGAFELNGTLAPISAGSIKTHGAAGPFTVDLPLSGTAGLECRSSGGNHQLVMPFATPVTMSAVSVTSGTGSVSDFSFTGTQLTVNLTGVTNAQQINVRLRNVSDGVQTNSVNIPMRLLLGDTTANSAVNASDVTQIKQQLGQPVTNANFRRDINANGTINASDVTITKSQIGTSIP